LKDQNLKISACIIYELIHFLSFLFFYRFTGVFFAPFPGAPSLKNYNNQDVYREAIRTRARLSRLPLYLSLTGAILSYRGGVNAGRAVV
jgi:hypothetical protein